MRQVMTAALVILATAFPAAAQEASDPAAGAALARTWCSGCHVVDPQQSRATDAVPSFAAIAAAPASTSASLHEFLAMPHAPMPDLKLSGQQIDNVVAYILSLRQR
jgi:mono/diheme cytochrome c family protein